MIQGRQRQVVDVDPHLPPPIRLVMLGVAIAVQARSRTERLQSIGAENVWLCQMTQQGSQLVPLRWQQPHQDGEETDKPAQETQVAHIDAMGQAI